MNPQPSFQQFVCLSGLPRSGSTLLSALLCQNPNIHAEGNSAVCQLMWDMQQSCSTTSKEQLLANRRIPTAKRLISSIPHIYYQGITEKVVVDKCRSWTLEPNIKLLRDFVDKNYKVIVLERPIVEIVQSFAKLYRSAGISNEEREKALVIPESEPVMRSLAGVLWAKEHNQEGNFLFIQYDELVSQPKETLDKIYAFCGWETFEHDFEKVEIKYPEMDEVYQLPGQHSVRAKVGKSKNNTVLSTTLTEQCRKIDNQIELFCKFNSMKQNPKSS
jgi:sulfotransferase